MNSEKIARINELYKKSKAEGLTSAERKEQALLRQEYVADFRKNLIGQLNNIDIQEKDGKYLLEVDLPGYDKKDINVSLEDGYLTVSANTNKNVEEKDENKNYIRRERQFGSCSRSFYVGDVNQEDISASYDNGILNISFPKAGKQIESKKNIDIK